MGEHYSAGNQHPSTLALRFATFTGQDHTGSLQSASPAQARCTWMFWRHHIAAKQEAVQAHGEEQPTCRGCVTEECFVPL